MMETARFSSSGDLTEFCRYTLMVMVKNNSDRRQAGKERNMDTIGRREKAMALHGQGYNCAQSVVLAFEDLLPLDGETLARLSASFGGGIGGMREVCGAVSGMAMVLGFLYGNSDPKDRAAKGEHSARVQALAGKFRERNGEVVCKRLLGLEPVPGKELKKRPCGEYVGDAAEFLEEYISSHS